MNCASCGEPLNGKAYIHNDKIYCGEDCIGEEREKNMLEESQKRFPFVSTEVLLGLERENALDILMNNWCVVNTTPDDEWCAQGFDSLSDLKKSIVSSYGEGAWEVHSIYKATLLAYNKCIKPVSFEIKIEVIIKED